MQLIADLHIHSRFARGCSKDLSIANLEKYARIKGIDVLGTGDFTHPHWLKELKQELKEDGSGLLQTKSGYKFMLQTEVSLIYTQDNKGRRIHHLILAPSFEIVDQINEALAKRGNLMSDGRPIIGRYSSIELVDDLMKISKDIEIIPAHVWTPWFAIFGSKSGFDSVEECFQEKSSYIHALETGMSSNPQMNWRISKLDKYNLVSNSDAHGFWPWRLGREANVFDVNPAYKDIINAIRTNKGFVETVEVDPGYGKYHFDGHRACNTCFTPQESKKHNNICPQCGKPLTIGVLNRIEELADRPENYVDKNRVPFRSLIPLSEIIAMITKKGVATKFVWEEYNKLIKHFTSEFNVLLNVPEKELAKIVDPNLARAIIFNREGKIKVKPGYDGEYGIPLWNPNNELRSY